MEVMSHLSVHYLHNLDMLMKKYIRFIVLICTLALVVV